MQAVGQEALELISLVSYLLERRLLQRDEIRRALGSGAPLSLLDSDLAALYLDDECANLQMEKEEINLAQSWSGAAKETDRYISKNCPRIRKV